MSKSRYPFKIVMLPRHTNILQHSTKDQNTFWIKTDVCVCRVYANHILNTLVNYLLAVRFCNYNDSIIAGR